MIPLGSLIMSFFADMFGILTTFTIMGISTISISLIFISYNVFRIWRRAIMNHKEWLLADKNIQYRTINAMIKEHIVSEGMRIKEGTCKVEIFLNNHLLSLKVARKVP